MMELINKKHSSHSTSIYPPTYISYYQLENASILSEGVLPKSMDHNYQQLQQADL